MQSSAGPGSRGSRWPGSLAVKHGMKNVVLVDERPPMTLTSDKSTEAYRNWWPDPDDAMVRLMNRSIDLLEEMAVASDNRFLMNRRGYLYATADPGRIEAMRASAELASRLRRGRGSSARRSRLQRVPSGIRPRDGRASPTAPTSSSTRV